VKAFILIDRSLPYDVGRLKIQEAELINFVWQKSENRNVLNWFACIFTAGHYASAVYAVIICLSVRPSICPSQADSLDDLERSSTPFTYCKPF